MEQTATWPLHKTIDVYSAARQITFSIAASVLAESPPEPTVDALSPLFYAWSDHNRRDRLLLSLITERLYRHKLRHDRNKGVDRARSAEL